MNSEIFRLFRMINALEDRIKKLEEVVIGDGK